MQQLKFDKRFVEHDSDGDSLIVAMALDVAFDSNFVDHC